MKTIKRIEPMSAAKLAAAMGAVLGLIQAVAALLFSRFTPLGMMGDIVSNPYAGTGVMVIVVLPIVMGIAGFIGGFVWAVIYNFVADKIGGIKIDLK